MVGWIISKLNLNADSSDYEEYVDCIRDLIDHEMVWSMKNYIQHRDIDCLEHSLYVSYNSYLICRRMGLDYRSAARGGLLHDFFLYDWHVTKPYKGLHGFMHPRIALQNANKYFYLNELEKEIILKHMWPLTITPPKHKEAYVVVLADKYCAFMEISKFGKRRNVNRLQRLLSY
ncbi:MAG: HD family hydrolase [Firmicutes bacterium]|nr:HD family hydrolase [Bacillota bacterium]MDI6704882.1 HD family phosphohydrolase [Bacillota bacterium]